MSGLPSYIQNPLFAPASQQQREQGQQQDDFDVNEIFAEYFINEFDDPLNAYTSSMANYSGGAVKMETDAVAVATQAQPMVQQTQQPQQQPSQPQQPGIAPSGVSTQFGNWAAQQQQQQHQQLPQQNHHQQQMQPVVKKARHEGVAAHPGAAMGIQGGLMANNSVAPKLALPVGGIRMGGIGGVSPASAQNSAVLHQPGQMMWDGNRDGMGGQPGISEQAIAERRQRNREHAKRSRVRKKFMLESLQEQVHQLQQENRGLRLLIQEHIPDKAQDIIAECCSKNPLFVDPENGDERQEVKLVRTDHTLMESLSASQQNFVLSDPRLPDNPIVFASPGFYRMTGYTPKEVLGRNCRFLQGPGTDTKSLDAMRKAIAIGADCTVCILNYKADGTPFWNQFFVAALRDSGNNIVNYVGVQCEVEPEAGANALEDKVNEVLPLMNKEDEE